MNSIKQRFQQFLNLSGKYAQTDMNYVISGGTWLLAGKIALATISFVVTLAFANWLPRETYGKYQYLITTLSLLGIFTLPGIHTALVKSIAQGKEGTLSLAVREKMKWGLIGSLVALGISGWYFLRQNPLLGTAFLIGAFFLPALETFHIYLQFWNGRKEFGRQMRYEVISAFFSAIFLVLAIYLSDNLIVIIATLLASRTFFDWLFYQRTLRQIKNKEEDSKAISFGKHLTIINFFTVIAAHIDKILIWKFLGAAQVAVYTFAQLPIQKIISTIPLVQLALPKLGEQNIAEKKVNIFKKFLKLFFVFLPLTLLFIFSAPFIYKIFFPQYNESIRYFQILSLLIALVPFSLLIASLVADLRQKELYIVNTAPQFLKIILFLSLTPIFGIWGAVASLLFTQILVSLLALFYFRRL
jgi:O-antigen/teichoic acid export membrane protein